MIRSLFAGLILFLPYGGLTATENGINPSSDTTIIKTSYDSFTQEILCSIPDSLLVKSIENYFERKLNGDYDRESEILRSLPPGFQIIYYTLSLEGLLLDGGFDQYFWQTQGLWIEDAIEAYRKIGAIKHANVVKNAYSFALKEIPILVQIKNHTNSESFTDVYLGADFKIYDKDFSKSNEDLSALRIKFIRNNIKLFLAKK